jgi:hypothetical protein
MTEPQPIGEDEETVFETLERFAKEQAEEATDPEKIIGWLV